MIGPLTTPPTKRQTDYLRFISGFIKEHGYAPSHREIRDAFGINSTNAVAEHIVALERRGMLQSSGGAKSRAMVITPKGYGHLGEPAMPMAARPDPRVDDLERRLALLEMAVLSLQNDAHRKSDTGGAK